jgi:hypothetical protein
MSKIPKYKSTTSINAIEEIKNEMSPDDVYVPMAARIKLFEKGLGNGSNKAPVSWLIACIPLLTVNFSGITHYSNNVNKK